jgi:general secretion pathway protein D
MARFKTTMHSTSPTARVHAVVLGLLLILAAVCSSPAAQAQSASTWNKRGQAAQSRKDYDAAYEDFRHAADKKPGDLRYRARLELMRFEAGMSHVDRGRLARQSGDLNVAFAEFARALEIDPSNQAAQQELDQVRLEQAAAAKAAAVLSPQPGEQTPEQRATQEELSSLASPVELKPIANDPISIHTVEDAKIVYQTVGKLAGLNVIFDPAFKPQRIAVDLTRVSLNDALRIVGLTAGAFYKPITRDTIYVAENTREKRAALDELAVQTFYLTNVATQADANEILTALRNLLEGNNRIFLIPSQNAIVMRGTPDQLLFAQKLLNDLDRARAEVVIDVAVLEVNRDHIRNLGITLPTSIGLTPTCTASTSSNACTSTSSTSSSTTSSTTATDTSSSQLTLNGLSNLNATNFAVSVSGATVNALLSDSDTRILQSPRIRATDGQNATLKIGSRIPIATGSFSSTLTATVGAGVQTQFQYIDVGVNIDVTPTVHFDHEITLKASIEVSSETGQVTISNVSEPIIGQNIIKQTIQLKEGEPSLLGGILTKQDTATSNGTPGLAQLPILKYIFGSQYKETQQGEIVFLMIPHLVREPAITRGNVRPIDTGTATAIELRHDETPNEDDALPIGAQPAPKTVNPTSLANAADAAVQQMKQQAAPPVPPKATVPTPANVRPPVSLSIQPPVSSQTVGNTFQVAVLVQNAHDVASVPLQLQFDPKVLQLVKIDSGELLTRGGQPPILTRNDDGPGLVSVNVARAAGAPAMEGQGALLVLTFHSLAAGDASISLSRVGARTTAQISLPAVGSQAVVHVK